MKSEGFSTAEDYDEALAQRSRIMKNELILTLQSYEN
jgi:hypothetical protein